MTAPERMEVGRGIREGRRERSEAQQEALERMGVKGGWAGRRGRSRPRLGTGKKGDEGRVRASSAGCCSREDRGGQGRREGAKELLKLPMLRRLCGL